MYTCRNNEYLHTINNNRPGNFSFKSNKNDSFACKFARKIVLTAVKGRVFLLSIFTFFVLHPCKGIGPPDKYFVLKANEI
jgi:hypothetical protein